MKWLSKKFIQWVNSVYLLKMITYWISVVVVVVVIVVVVVVVVIVVVIVVVVVVVVGSSSSSNSSSNSSSSSSSSSSSRSSSSSSSTSSTSSSSSSNNDNNNSSSSRSCCCCCIISSCSIINSSKCNYIFFNLLQCFPLVVMTWTPRPPQSLGSHYPDEKHAIENDITSRHKTDWSCGWRGTFVFTIRCLTCISDCV